MQDEAHSENEDNLKKEKDFNKILETERSDLSKWLSEQKPPKCGKKWNKKDNNKFENAHPPQYNQLDQVTPTSLFNIFGGFDKFMCPKV